MHSFLLIGSDDKKIEEEIRKVSSKLKAKVLEFPGQKIEEIRNLNSFSSLKLQEKTIILLKDIENSTTEAMNAFLKNLEEPQEDLFYVLTASSIHKVLPTIASRCQIIKTSYEKQGTEDEKDFEYFLKMKTAQKLAYFDKIKKREEAIDFVKRLIFFLHSKLIREDKKQSFFAKLIEFSQETLTSLEANGNVTLQLTNFAINTGKIDTSTE